MSTLYLYPSAPVVTGLHDAEDAFLNALIHPTDPIECVRQVLIQFINHGISHETIDKYIVTAKEMHIPVPDIPEFSPNSYKIYVIVTVYKN